MINFRYVVYLLAFLGIAAVCLAPGLAQAQVEQTCNNNTDGPRKSIQCTFTQPALGMVWKGRASSARKLYVRKPEGDTGREVVRLWIGGVSSGEFIIKPGDAIQIFRKHSNSTIAARVEVETLELPNSGPSIIYVHFETLDPPVMPDLSQCSNTVNADRQSVCWTGNF